MKIFFSFGKCSGKSYLTDQQSAVIEVEQSIYSEQGIAEARKKLANKMEWPVGDTRITFFSIEQNSQGN
jgi:hypothetical protein